MAYFISNTTYNSVSINIDYDGALLPETVIITIPVGKNLSEMIDLINTDLASTPVVLDLEKDTLQFYNSLIGKDIINIQITTDTETTILLGGTYNIVDGVAIASSFGGRLPFNFTLENPPAYTHLPKNVGGINGEKEPLDKDLAGETYNGVNGSSSTKFIERTGYKFNFRLNTETLEPFKWFIESCRKSNVTIKNATQYRFKEETIYDIQLEESKGRTMIYPHLDIFEKGLGLLER